MSQHMSHFTRASDDEEGSICRLYSSPMWSDRQRCVHHLERRAGACSLITRLGGATVADHAAEPRRRRRDRARRNGCSQSHPGGRRDAHCHSSCSVTPGRRSSRCTTAQFGRGRQSVAAAKPCRFADHPTAPVTPIHRWSRSPGMGGRDPSERVVAINWNEWSRSIGNAGRDHPVRALFHQNRLRGDIEPAISYSVQTDIESASCRQVPRRL